MVYCAVVGCNSSNNKKGKNNVPVPGCRYFRFPTSKDISNLWVQKCYQKHDFNIKNARICSEHFSDDDFCMKEKLLQLPKSKWKLKRDAVPSLNLAKSPKSRTSKQKDRDIRIRKRDLFKNIHKQEKHDQECNMDGVDEVSKMDTSEHNLETTSTSTNSRDVATQTATQCSQYESELLKKVRDLEKENFHLKELLEKEKESTKSVEKLFTEGQLRKLKSGKLIHWTIEDVTSAISLYAGGPRSYRLLRKRGYPFPAVSTLRRWASKVNIEPGILNIVLRLMKNTTLTKMERSCVLLFDEMKIQSIYTYDKKNDTTMAPTKYVQVIMARGICGNWKQPIFYDYDCKMTKALIFKIITKLENIGYPVYALNCDLGGSNRGLWNSLNISEENTSFENPVTRKAVHIFADTPHMIKLLRNHFLDHGYLLDGKIINSKPVVDLLENTKTLDLNIAHKLSADLLTVKGAQRQKVKYATKLFSHTISRAISRVGMLGHYETENNWSECSDFFKIVNDWFDVFNSQSPHPDSRNRVKGYGLALVEQDKALDKMENMVKGMRKMGTSTLLPFQKGIIISIKSLKELFIDLKQDFDIKYILTYQLNQDPLEGLFSIIRAIGGLHDHPNALQFKYRLRNYLMGRNDEVISDSANIQEETILQPSTSEYILNEQKNLNFQALTGELFCSLDLPENDDAEKQISDEDDSGNRTALEELRWDGLENLAGFIAFKLRNKANLGYIPDCNEGSFSWVNHLSEGGLRKPTTDFLTKCNELDHIFTNYNGDLLKIEKNYVKNLINLAKNVDLIDEAKDLFFRCKMYFKIRTLNKNIKETSNIRKRKMIKIAK